MKRSFSSIRAAVMAAALTAAGAVSAAADGLKTAEKIIENSNR